MMRLEFSKRVGLRLWINKERAYEVSLLLPPNAKWYHYIGIPYNLEVKDEIKEKEMRKTQ